MAMSLRNDLYCVEWGVKLYSNCGLVFWPTLYMCVCIYVYWQAGNDSDSEFSGCTTCRDSGMDPSEDSDHVPCVRPLT